MRKSKYGFIVFVVVCSFFVSPIPATSLADEANARPNILLIFLDDFGWKDTGFMGSDFYETPHLDRLAKSGMVFDNAYSCAANCAPARACLLSGQYTPRHQIYNVGTTPRGKPAFRRLEHIAGEKTLNPNIRTWAHQLQKSGYRTATMGKWHLSDDPIPYGFDVNIGGTHAGGPPKGYYPPHGKAPNLGDAPAGEYLTDRLSAEACKFIRANHDRPWMLYLTHFAVHTPLNAKKELVAKYESKQPGKLHQHVPMATMIQSVDDGVGLIVQTLEQLKLTSNTLILFYSDNGGYGPATDMDPLKGYKGTYYEGGIRVPFFANWPGKIAGGVTNSEPIIGVDIYPTLCEVAQTELPKNQVSDGVSLLPLFLGERKSLATEDQPRSLFWHFPAYLQSYKVIDEQRDPLFRSRPCSAIRRGKWKLIEYFESGDVELFDLQQDISESFDQSSRMPNLRNELLSELKRWQTQTNAAIPTLPNPSYDAYEEQSAIKKIKLSKSRKKSKRN